MPPLDLNPAGAITHIFSQNVLSTCQTIIFKRGSEKKGVPKEGPEGGKEGSPDGGEFSSSNQSLVNNFILLFLLPSLTERF